ENEEKQDMVLVSFEGNEVTYTRNDLNQLTLAYCCSVHKSQGSEFPIVILPIVKSYYRMLRRNLIYTAITRSKQFLIICGEEEALRIGVERADDQARNTKLSDKLIEALAPMRQAVQESPQTAHDSEQVELSYEEKLLLTDPLIGMEQLTPYDFMEEEKIPAK
ncbi:MAG: ATP-binding domain-containing protein, partial [Bacillus sp. (in: firmicutes)]